MMLATKKSIGASLTNHKISESSIKLKYIQRCEVVENTPTENNLTLESETGNAKNVPSFVEIELQNRNKIGN